MTRTFETATKDFTYTPTGDPFQDFLNVCACHGLGHEIFKDYKTQQYTNCGELLGGAISLARALVKTSGRKDWFVTTAMLLARRVLLRLRHKEAIGIMMPISTNTAQAVLATMLASKMVVNIPTILSWRQVLASLAAGFCSKVVTTQAAYRKWEADNNASLPPWVRIIFLDDHPMELLSDFEPPQSAASLRRQIGAEPLGLDDGLFVCGTSGSTNTKGLPKIAVHSVRNLQTALAGMVADPGVRPLRADRTIGFVSISGIVGVTHLLLTLITGVPRVMFEYQRPSHMRDVVYNEKITVLIGNPKVANDVMQLVMEGGPKPDHLRAIITGGGAPYPGFALRMQAYGVHYVNYFGATESSAAGFAWCSEYGFRTVGVRYLVADEAALSTGLVRPVPLGQPGALLLSGDAIVRDYYRIPFVLTKRLDVCHDQGTRWYVTGDVVIQQNDETMDFVGRLDDRVTRPDGTFASTSLIEAALQGAGHNVVVAANHKDSQSVITVFVLAGDWNDDGGVTRMREKCKAALLGTEFTAMPDRVCVVDLPHWPYGNGGKILRGKMLSEIAKGIISARKFSLDA